MMEGIITKKIKKCMRGGGVLVSILKSHILKTNRPALMYIHLTNRCNLRCKYCYANVEDRFNDNERKDFTTEEWKQVIDDAFTLGGRYFHLYGGEPLLRDDIGELIRHCQKKSGFVEIFTNGHLIEQRLSYIKSVDSICLSLDGDKSTNDQLRGNGNFLAVKNAVLVCKREGIPVRLHAVIHSFNLAHPEYLPRLAKEWRVTVSYSQPHIFSYIQDKHIELSDYEIRSFWRKLRDLKKIGMPIDNTYKALNYVINWPLSYQHIIKTEAEFKRICHDKHTKLIPCKMGKTAVVIDSEGSLLPCLNFGMFNENNFKEGGFKEAYRKLSTRECYACSHLQFAEVNLASYLDPASIFKGLSHHL